MPQPWLSKLWKPADAFVKLAKRVNIVEPIKAEFGTRDAGRGIRQDAAQGISESQVTSPESRTEVQ
jgi:hypothetical protein